LIIEGTLTFVVFWGINLFAEALTERTKESNSFVESSFVGSQLVSSIFEILFNTHLAHFVKWLINKIFLCTSFCAPHRRLDIILDGYL